MRLEIVGTAKADSKNRHLFGDFCEGDYYSVMLLGGLKSQAKILHCNLNHREDSRACGHIVATHAGWLGRVCSTGFRSGYIRYLG